MAIFLKVMTDSDGRESIFMFEHGVETPIRSITRQEVEILRQSCDRVDEEHVSLNLPAPADKQDFSQIATIKRSRS